jgi:hypothetical protein
MKVETPKKSAKEDKPVIQYFGEGAEKVKFEVDPKAKLIRVYGTGIVLVDY